MTATTTISPYMINVTDQTFATEVLERSKTTPVVVDFWAAWCGPCRMLGPILEKLATEYQGAFILAKVDVDSNPQLAMQYRVQSIPAVKAFRNGRVAGEFIGAQPEPQVRRFLAGLIPSEVDLLAKQGLEWEVNNQPAMAEANYRAVLEKKADYYPAKIGLGRVLLNQNKRDEAISILQSIPAGVKERTVADALLAGAEFHQFAAGHTEEELKANLAANPNDIPGRYALASLYASKQQYAQAMDEFLEVVRRDRSFNNDGARKAMLAIFTIIGEEQSLTRDYRQKLANILF
jgi:putative thioredoxin